ncbi:MAG: hypothetical protein EZS28_018240 [Streblomastix strix]|uniref:PI3K/PI4K catalytic domain-containing protein n=1 Tax=Streblomastix strix TaxID=222440 RepID=A0A5J4VUP1_9EUKA|nr:MAG: hypothetical protein EZS28_018240 [Streblomastix strix]
MMEFVDNTCTFDNGIVPQKDTKEYEMFMQTLTKSVAANAFFIYLFGIADRHNDNILFKINPATHHLTGQILHIDFGFILGQRVGMKFEDPTLGIKRNIVDLFKDNQAYKQLLSMLTQFIFIFRKQIDTLFVILNTAQEVISQEIKAKFGQGGGNQAPNDVMLTQWLAERLSPEIADSDLDLKAQQLVQQNREKLFGDWLNDLFHHLAN